jgi:glycine C-acetyltransferase
VPESASAAESQFDGKQVVNLASNNYLGLTTHPKLREAAIEAVRKYGVGSGAVRTISGTMRLHLDLEERIARFKNVEACVVFQSGFAANAGTGKFPNATAFPTTCAVGSFSSGPASSP